MPGQKKASRMDLLGHIHVYVDEICKHLIRGIQRMAADRRQTIVIRGVGTSHWRDIRISPRRYQSGIVWRITETLTMKINICRRTMFFPYIP